MFEELFGGGRDGGDRLRVRDALASVTSAARRAFRAHEVHRRKREEYATYVRGFSSSNNPLEKSLATAKKDLVAEEARPLAEARQRAIDERCAQEQAARDLGISGTEIVKAREAGKSDARAELK